MSDVKGSHKKPGKRPGKDEVAPDERPLTKIQAARLSDLTSIAVEELAGRSLAELEPALRWKLEPHFLNFRRVCGRVVQEDPATGDLWGVPNATVHVEDTDCSYLSYFPVGYSLGWLYPFNCHREVIATATTDECGNFCVWVPRWEIDWIVQWRKGQLCFPELVVPRICDLLKIDPRVIDDLIIRDPRPQPDPPPFVVDIDRIREVGGERVARRVEDGLEARAFGASITDLAGALQSPTLPLPPPKLPVDIQREASEAALRVDGLPFDETLLEQVDFDRWIGPFLRCVDIYYPQWTAIFDVPDITFRVTQPTGSGDVTVYSESYFQVRWDSGPIGNVELRANGNAIATPLCDGPVIDPEACSEPTIVTAGLMPLEATYHDAVEGYALRPNKPRPGGFASSPQSSPAQAPYLRTVQLHGCHRFNGAQFYRLLHAFEGGTEVPFTGVSWYTPRLDGTGNDLVSPDPNGWYPILNAADYVFPHWLFNWPTGGYANGKHVVRLEIGDAAKNPIGTSATVAFHVDNTAPTATFDSLGWRPAGSLATPTPLDTLCPVIRRPLTQAIEIIATYAAGAKHFRDVKLTASGCDSSATITPTGLASDYEHWHENHGDNTYSRTAVFHVPAGTTEGPYVLSLRARGRGFNPAGSDGGPGADWNYDPVYSRSYPSRSICIINT